MEGGNIQEAIKEFQSFRYALLNTDQYTRLDGILALFPKKEQNSNIELVLVKAVILENKGKYEALASQLEEILSQTDIELLSPHQKGELKFWQAMLLFYAGEFKKSKLLITEAINLMEAYASSIITFAYVYKSLAMNALGEREQAIQMLKIRLDSMHVNEHQSIAITLVAKAILYSMYSDIQNRQKIVPRIIEISEKYNYYETLGIGIHYFIEYKYRTGLYQRCDEYYEKALELKHLFRPSWFVYLLGIYVYCKLWSNPDKVKEILKQLDIYVYELNSENMVQFKNALLIKLPKNKVMIVLL